ncbi:long-chain fatty acid--CoA ligase [Balneola sp. MJW-20]|uniref:long-chain-fatty-acid--CoA ligase n=1 Tax=Gracilimonas aurantiaca TaxID=3234185 RepID=UPI003466ECE0
MLNLSVLLENNARKIPQKTAIVFGEQEFSYAQVNGAANQIANALDKMGIGPGDKVALSCPNLPHFPMIYFGILKTGAVVVPLSVLLKKDEVAYHLNDSDAKAYFCFIGNDELPMGKRGYEGFKDAPRCHNMFLIMPAADMESPFEGVETLSDLMKERSPAYECRQTGAEDTALIIYTSGTTGKPKGAELTHSNLLLNAILSCDLVNSEKEDRLLIALPLFHIFGMTTLMNAGLYKGATCILVARFEPGEILQIMQNKEVTIFAGVPTMYWALNHFNNGNIDYKKISRSLKIATSGGAAMPAQVLNEFEERFNVPILEGYGMSEGSPVVTFNHLDVGKKIGSIGTPVWGVEVMIVDENEQELPPGEKGELIYRGHNVMKGYYKKHEATEETIRNGWLYSGDIAYMDEDGFFYIVDRTKDMIIRGGFNVYPREIEEVMITHEEVSLVAVIGVPDEKFGEDIKAFVVKTEGSGLNEKELRSWCKERMADYKYPRFIEFLDKLPMSATGKILKKELR